MITPVRDSIRHLTVQWRGPVVEARTPAAALRLERQFDAVDWRPAGLRPGQILLIRRLRGLPPLRAGHGWALAWEAAVHEEVTRLYRSAVRPGRGIPTDAESILFDDPAMLLTCLTQEVVEQPALITDGSRLPWYWSQVVSTPLAASPGGFITALWVQYAAHLPRAVQDLPAVVVESALQRLSPTEIRLVLQAVAAAFGVTTPRLDAPAEEASLVPSSGSLSPDERPAPAEPLQQHLPIAVIAPWSRWLPPQRLQRLPQGRLGQVLIGWCAALAQQPAYAASPDFIRQIADWWAVPTSSADWIASVQPVDEMPPSHTQKKTPSTREPRPAATSSPKTDAAPVVEIIDTEDERLPEVVNTPLAGELTRLGGVFFLIHLLSWLDLPAAYDVRCPPWLLIEAMARALLQPLTPVDERDPIWALLRRLAAAEEAPAVEELAFRLPIAWLRYLPADLTVQVSYQADRLLFTHSSLGFVLLDVPISDTMQAAPAVLLEPYREVGFRIQVEDAAGTFPQVEPAHPTALDWWMSRAAGFIRALLQSSLPEVEDAGAFLLRRAGQVHLSRTHLDLDLPMERADVRLRRAGLDFDPGWVPALGYIVHFHYREQGAS